VAERSFREEARCGKKRTVRAIGTEGGEVSHIKVKREKKKKKSRRISFDRNGGKKGGKKKGVSERFSRLRERNVAIPSTIPLIGKKKNPSSWWRRKKKERRSGNSSQQIQISFRLAQKKQERCRGHLGLVTEDKEKEKKISDSFLRRGPCRKRKRGRRRKHGARASLLAR